MQAIIEAVKNFITFITNIVNFVFELMKDLVYYVQTVLNITVQVPRWLTFLPSIMLPPLVACLALVVVYKVLGRD